MYEIVNMTTQFYHFPLIKWGGGLDKTKKTLKTKWTKVLTNVIVCPTMFYLNRLTNIDLAQTHFYLFFKAH